MSRYSIHVCRFDTTLDIQKPTYEKIKQRVLETGKFSVFEPTKKTAWIFNALRLDPDVELFDIGFPWTGVRLKATR